MGERGDRRLRGLIAEEAARSMREDGVKQYLTAKRRAARTIGRGRWTHPRDLPSNGEIQAALLRQAALAEGVGRVERLFAMRIEALEIMEALEAVQPRLIGSVWSGHARRGSDIDLHVFPTSRAHLEVLLRAQGWRFAWREVLIRVGSDLQTFHHVDLEGTRFPVELSVYAPRELRRRTRSSTDGKPIDRVSIPRLRSLLASEHQAAWSDYLDTGWVDWSESDAKGPYDGLLSAMGGQEEA